MRTTLTTCGASLSLPRSFSSAPRNCILRSSIIVLASLAIPSLAQQQNGDVLFRAMRDELQRSTGKLQLEKLDKPYFIAYKIVDTDSKSADATFGALTAQNEFRRRLVSVEVHVGSYLRDNTNFFSMRMGPSGVSRNFAEGGINTPLDDDYDEIRRQLWIATDSAYKQALDDYAKKKAVLENRNRTDDAADMSQEKPATDREIVNGDPVKLTDVAGFVRDLSALFRSTPAIDHSTARLSATHSTTRYLNTEGTEYLRVSPSISLTVAADAQAADGMPLSDAESWYGRSLRDLPGKDAIIARVKQLQAGLAKLKDAATIERYTGPVLFEGSAAAELLGQTIIPAFIGLPRLVVDNEQFAGAFGADQGGMRDKIGSRILPSFLNITDDATVKDFEGTPLHGGYQVDEDGVPARPNRVVERGVFKQLLVSRALVAGAGLNSTGNRRTSGTMPSNVLVSATQTSTAAELKAKLIAAAKERHSEYGVIIRRIANPNAPKPSGQGRIISITIGGSGGTGMSGYTIEPVIEAYKVYADGREELIRNLQIAGMSIGNFRDILAAGDKPVAYTGAYQNNRRNPFMGGPIFAGPQLISIVTPGLLFEEVTLQRPIGEVPKLPFTRHPAFESK